MTDSDLTLQYLELLRCMAAVLEMEEVAGMRSLSHIPRDERLQLTTDRQRVCDMLATRVNVLKQRITRKDELLQGYERDLHKLRYLWN